MVGLTLLAGTTGDDGIITRLSRNGHGSQAREPLLPSKGAQMNPLDWVRQQFGLTAPETAQPMTNPAPARTPVFDKAPPWFHWALKELGTHEVGDNRGPDIRRYIKLARAGAEGEPWCAIFCNAALEASGVPGTRSASSQSFRDDPHFVHLSGPCLGAIVVFWRNSHSSGLGHVGFYRGERDGYIWTLGGNEADQVQIEAMAKAGSSFGLVGYYWPKGYPVPTLGPVHVAENAPTHQVKVT